MSSHPRSGRPVMWAALATGTAAWLWGSAATADERRYQAQVEALQQQAPRPSNAEPFTEATAAISMPVTCATNQETAIPRLLRTAHQTQASESFNGLLTKRR